jgi:hypothetical protein
MLGGENDLLAHGVCNITKSNPRSASINHQVKREKNRSKLLKTHEYERSRILPGPVKLNDKRSKR